MPPSNEPERAPERRIGPLLRDGLIACISCLAIDARLPRERVHAVAARFLYFGGGYGQATDVCDRCGARTEVLFFAPSRAEHCLESGQRAA